MGYRHGPGPRARVDDILTWPEFTAVTGPEGRLLSRVGTGWLVSLLGWWAVPEWLRGVTRRAHARFLRAEPHLCGRRANVRENVLVGGGRCAARRRSVAAITTPHRLKLSGINKTPSAQPCKSRRRPTGETLTRRATTIGSSTGQRHGDGHKWNLAS